MLASLCYSLLTVAGMLMSSNALSLPVPNEPGTCSQNKDVASNQPTTGGLPNNSGLQFKYAFVGVGVQNYSCASASSPPASVGALATLFDATELFTVLGKPIIDNISGVYLRAYEQESCTKFGSTDVTQDDCEKRVNVLQLPVAGHHYFAQVNGKGVPTFDISKSSDLLSSKKSAGVAAPLGAYTGANHAGAVDWLYLVDDGTTKSHGVKEVYRVQTAGGDPVSAACAQGAKVVGIKYVAEYWFYN